MKGREAAEKAKEKKGADSIRNGETEQVHPEGSGSFSDVGNDAPSTSIAVREPVKDTLARAEQAGSFGEFEPVSSKEDKFQRYMCLFPNVGDVFVGRFERSIAQKTEPDNLKQTMLEFIDVNGTAALLPSHMQLWDFFTEIVEPDVERRKSIFRITCVERVPNDNPADPRDKFVRYRIEESRFRPQQVDTK